MRKVFFLLSEKLWLYLKGISTHYSKRDKFMYTLHKLSEWKLRKEGEEKDKVIRLCSDILADILGDKYIDIISQLIKDNIIELVDEYRNDPINGKCRSYRLTEEYINQEGQWIAATNQNSCFINKVRAFKGMFERGLTPSQKELREKLKTNSEQIEIDWMGAVTYCINQLKRNFTFIYDITEEVDKIILNKETDDTIFYRKLRDGIRDSLTKRGVDLKYTPKSFSFSDPVEIPTYFYSKFLHDIITIESIMLEQWRFKADKYGRAHSNYTNVSGVIKRFISIDNKLMVSIDIANSQPLFLACLMNAEIPADNWQPDMLEYQRLCEKGRLYEYLQEQCSVSRTRNWIKEELFSSLLFCRVHTQTTSEFGKLFKLAFPNVYDFILAKKKEKKGKDAFKELSYQLQRAESSLVLDDAVKSLFDNVDGIRLLTVHDSIVCFKEDQEVVMEAFKNAFESIGICPTFKVESLNDNNHFQDSS